MASKTRTDYEKEWRDGVTNGLTRANARIDEVHAQLTELRSSELSLIKSEIAVLKVKAGMWGAAAAAIVTGVVNWMLHK